MWRLSFVLVLLGTTWLLTTPAQGSGAEVEQQARALETRLLAPCCYQQTLDTHNSELTTELRHELRRRLAEGETSKAIEQNMVERYGERIVAVPPSSPLEVVALASIVGVFMAGALVWLRARGWVRRGAAARRQQPESEASDDEAYDAALDKALESLDR
jgi:cytochrome c-type biogenesis protein CcmH